MFTGTESDGKSHDQQVPSEKAGDPILPLSLQEGRESTVKFIIRTCGHKD